jgi:predicted transcriptional regulator
MNSGTKALLERVESWPTEYQEELADFIREVESRRTGVYRLSEDERAAVREGMEDARRGNFATDEEIETFYQLHRGA